MNRLIILAVTLALTSPVVLMVACTPAQQTKLAADQQKIETAVAANAARITLACNDVLAVANNPLTDLAVMTVPVVAQVQAGVKGGCSTAEGIASMAQSASTVDWLQSAQVVMASKGTVLPAPVAPLPISGT